MNQYNDKGNKHGYWEEAINGESQEGEIRLLCTFKGNYNDGTKIGKWDLHERGKVINTYSFISQNLYSLIQYDTLSNTPEIKTLFKKLGYTTKIIYTERYNVFGDITFFNSTNEYNETIGELYSEGDKNLLYKPCYLNPESNVEAFPTYDKQGRIIEMRDSDSYKILGYADYNMDGTIRRYADMMGNFYDEDMNTNCFFTLEESFPMGIIAYPMNHPKLKNVLTPLKKNFFKKTNHSHRTQLCTDFIYEDPKNTR